MPATLDPPAAPPKSGRAPLPAVRESHAFTFATGADWWDAIGRVPLERVVFDPPPGTATEADVLRLDDHEDRLCELVHGTLVEKTVSTEESIIAGNCVRHLGNFTAPERLGVVTAPDGMLRILRLQIRIPDVSFIARERLPSGVNRGRVWTVAPDLAVEVLSDSNTRLEMANKLAEYFEAGTRLVWYLDPPTRTIEVFTSITDVVQLGPDDTLTGGDVLPGFEIKVADLFVID